jgi:hypothetical protein
MVPGTGLEPACLAALAPKASVSASSTIPACHATHLAKVVTAFAKTACSVYQVPYGTKKMDPLLTADPSQLKRAAKPNYCTVSVIDGVDWFTSFAVPVTTTE